VRYLLSWSWRICRVTILAVSSAGVAGSSTRICPTSERAFVWVRGERSEHSRMRSLGRRCR
jgi:hypothetical protein